jgi:hypothetical protein
MTITTPLSTIPAIAADACDRLPGLESCHLLAGSLLAANSAAPEIRNLLTSLTRWGRKP